MKICVQNSSLPTGKGQQSQFKGGKERERRKKNEAKIALSGYGQLQTAIVPSAYPHHRKISWVLACSYIALGTLIFKWLCGTWGETGENPT